MRFWKRKRRAAAVPERPGSKPASGKRFPVEVKVLAAQAKEAGLGRTKIVRGPHRNFQVYDPLDFLTAGHD